MPLTDTAIKGAKPRDKSYKLSDGKGLYLLVNPNGSKYFRLKYRFGGIEKTFALGVYSETSLKLAREKCDAARELLAQGIDPNEHKKAAKHSAIAAATNSFELVAREWHTKFKVKWTADHAKRLLTRLEHDVFPYLGNRPINEITAPELLHVMRRIEARDVIDTLHRVLQNCGQIFRYGIATGHCDRDPSGDLRGALTPVKSKHHASIIDPKEIGQLLRAIDDYQGSFVVRLALKFSALTFCRPGEIRKAEWQEIDIENKQWRIPADKMKMRQLHIVPLANQTIEILNELKTITGEGKYLFPSERSQNRPMSENTVNAALRRMDYSKEQATAHGFRSTASTRLNEMGFNRDWIERQLAHSEKNDVRGAYNYAEFLEGRTEMMQQWANYIEHLKANTSPS